MPTADSIQTGIIPGIITGQSPSGTAAWKQIVIRYQKPSWWRAAWQLVNTLVPYAALWYLMYVCVAVSYWLIVPLSILAGGFMVRLFIIHHDCGHGSFLRSRRANKTHYEEVLVVRVHPGIPRGQALPEGLIAKQAIFGERYRSIVGYDLISGGDSSDDP